MSNPSPGGNGATPPTNNPPVTGTPAPGATPTPASQPNTPTLSHDDALKRLAELESTLAATRQESIKHRKALDAHEEAAKQAELQKLGDLERTQKQLADLQSQHATYTRTMQERMVRYEIQIQAAKQGIIDPDAAAKLLDWTEIEYDEDGTPKNTDKLLAKLLKEKPYLASQQQSNPQQQQQPGPPQIPPMNPGRGLINSPNPLATGAGTKIPRLNDVFSAMKKQ